MRSLFMRLFSLPASQWRDYNRAVMERAAYRIMDANFNRAREALRVMEEYCRFALNSRDAERAGQGTAA